MLEMFKKHKVLALLGLVFILVACAPAAPEPEVPGVGENGENGVEVEAPAVGGGEFVWIASADPQSINPRATADAPNTHVGSQIFEGLTWFDPTVPYVSIQPLLAESFGQIDEYTWYFNLRSGIYFHDGAYFNADAVVTSLEWSLEQEFSEVTGQYEFIAPQAFILDMINEIVAVDEYTVHITTEFPFAPLAGHLAHRIGFIVSPDAIAEDRAGGTLIAEHPVGTGPFRFYNRVYGDYIRMVRNENYWGTPAIPDSVVFRTIPEAGVRFALIETGEAHGLIGMPADYASARALGLDVRLQNTTTLDYIGFNTQPGHVLSNRLLRQAITMAINTDDILAYLADGIGFPAEGPLAPMVAFAPQGAQSLPYDPVRAAELLAEAGFPGGGGLELNFWYNDGNSFREHVGVFVQGALAELGITVHVSGMEWSAYLDATGAGEHDMFMLGWVTTTGDADYGIHPLFHSVQMGVPGNRTFFNNPEADALIDAGRSAPPEERYAIYEELVALLNYEAPKIFVRFQQSIVLSSGVDNLYVDFGGTPYFFAATFRD